jgi:hypothetical protein
MSQVPYLTEIDDRFNVLEAIAIGGALADGKMIVGNGAGVAAPVTMSGDVTISNAGVASIGANKVVTAKILDANVTSAKLAVALQPSHVVKYAGTFQTVGGDAAESIPVSGALGTDIALVFLKAKGASPVTILCAAAGTDAIAVTMSGDPSTDHYLYYVVFRAA